MAPSGHGASPLSFKLCPHSFKYSSSGLFLSLPVGSSQKAGYVFFTNARRCPPHTTIFFFFSGSRGYSDSGPIPWQWQRPQPAGRFHILSDPRSPGSRARNLQNNFIPILICHSGQPATNEDHHGDWSVLSMEVSLSTTIFEAYTDWFTVAMVFCRIISPSCWRPSVSRMLRPKRLSMGVCKSGTSFWLLALLCWLIASDDDPCSSHPILECWSVSILIAILLRSI